MGLSSSTQNQDIQGGRESADYKYMAGDIMDEEIVEGLSVKDAISHVNQCLVERQKNPEAPIKIPGMAWYGCKLYKIKEEEEKVKTKPKKSTPMDFEIQKKFLIDQSKSKLKEQKWF